MTVLIIFATAIVSAGPMGYPLWRADQRNILLEDTINQMRRKEGIPVPAPLPTKQERKPSLPAHPTAV